MKKFDTLRSRIVPLPGDHIDTDQIIPARFLKSTVRSGFGDYLFCDWRFDAEGKPKKDFVLNNPEYSGSILLTGANFGCGSSREHAAWALAAYGFSVIIASGFADIFRNNALNNGLLPVELPETVIRTLFDTVKENPSAELLVDLNKQLVTWPAQQGREFIVEPFQVNAYKRHCLLEGIDDIDFLLSIRKKTETYEKTSRYIQLLQEP